MKSTEPPVVVEAEFAAPIDAVWAALTQLDQMQQWYFENIPAFAPTVGSETRFSVESDGREFLHVWTVTEADAPHRLAYDWRYEGYQGDSHVLFELETAGDGTRFRLTHAAVSDFDAEVPEFSRENCLAGWDYFIHERLKPFLES